MSMLPAAASDLTLPPTLLDPVYNVVSPPETLLQPQDTERVSG